MKKLLLSALILFIVGSLGLSAQSLSVMAEENPPFNSAKDGTASGAATDLFLEMAKRAKVVLTRADVKTTPWARAYDIIQTNKDTVLFPMARTAAREALFKWVGPLYKVQIGLIAPKAKKLAIKSGADAAKYKIGTVKDGAPEQAIIAAGVAADLLDRGPDLVTNLRKLEAGRIDMIAFNATAAKFNMGTMGMNPDDYEVVFVLSEPELYFAFSKDTADATIKAFQKALDDMKADGTYLPIIKKFVK